LPYSNWPTTKKGGTWTKAVASTKWRRFQCNGAGFSGMADGDKAAPGDEPPAEEPSKKHDQAFFLDRAAKGKDAWNAWRRDPANKDVRVTFEGVDFSEAPKDQIDFSGFKFGHHANFSKCKWRGAEWRESEDNRETFTIGGACFTSATFGHGARFYSSAFGSGADFSGAKFDHGASFPNAVFGPRIRSRHRRFSAPVYHRSPRC
jgi:hypothetical protein